MDIALCTLDSKVWSSERFQELSPSERQPLKAHLLCESCGGMAWFVRESRNGRPPHFGAHHEEDCSLKVRYTVVDDPVDGQGQSDEKSGNDGVIEVHLANEQGGAIETPPVHSPDARPIGAGTAHIGKFDGRQSSKQSTLRGILFNLIRSRDYRARSDTVRFFDNQDRLMFEGPINQVISDFSSLSPDKHDGGHKQFYWGPIASAGMTPDGKLWLNSTGNHKEASVQIFSDIVDEFLDRFRVEELEDLEGAYVLAAGPCYFSKSSGKPIVYCGTTNYIFVHKYKTQFAEPE